MKIRKLFSSGMRILKIIKVKLSPGVQAILQPFSTLVRSLWSLLNSFVRAIAETPADACKTVTERLEKRVQTLEEQMEKNEAERKKKQFDRKIQSGVQALFNSRNFLENEKNSRIVKVLMITALQLISIRTTCRGLVQCFSDPVISILFSAVIQGGITYICSTVSYNHTSRMKIALLAGFLCLSIGFSYFGVSEKLLSYSEYVAENYNRYLDAYTAAKAEAVAATELSQDPAPEIEGAYAMMDQLLSDAHARCGDEALAGIEDEIAYYEGKKIPQEVPQRDRVTTLTSGETVVIRGGSKMVDMPDPAASAPLAEARKNKQELIALRTQADELSDMLANDYALDHVKEIVDRQRLSTAGMHSDFLQLNAKFPLVLEKCRLLARSLGENVDIKLDLYALVRNAGSAAMVQKLRSAREFSELREQWNGEETSLSGVAVLDGLLGADAGRIPSRLKELADQEVKNSYQSLVQVFSHVSNDEALGNLTTAYFAYHVDSPFIHGVSALSTGSADFTNGMIAVIIALGNDLLALMVGLFMENRRLNYGGTDTISPHDLRNHMYESLENVIKPMINQKLLKDSLDVSSEHVARAFSEIIEGFLDQFGLCPRLIDEGFSRCMRGEPDPKYAGLVSLLLSLGMMKVLRPDEAVSMGLIPPEPPADGKDYLLLSSRGEAWLMELLGSTDIIAVPELSN